MGKPIDILFLIVWAASIPLIPYALLRGRQELLTASVLVFFLLLINVFMMLSRPNPDNVILIQVVE